MNSGSTPDIGTVATIDIGGLSVRYARSGASRGVPILLTAPWPESIYAFHQVLPRLGSQHPLLAVDLPGFGLSQSRPEVMAPEAMGGFLVTLLRRFGISRTHVLAPDVGALAVLFAAAKQQDLFESLALGSAAALCQPHDTRSAVTGGSGLVDQGVEAVSVAHGDAAACHLDPVFGFPGLQVLIHNLPRHAEELRELLLGNFQLDSVRRHTTM